MDQFIAGPMVAGNMSDNRQHDIDVGLNAIYAKSMMAKPVLWLISFILKQAIARHLREMRNDS
ncbi:hypothetical protein [Gimesia fumaroli]|uniref:hypothetical protein n=1 Tax=Gimesia fumaroli TaxID=2527976 RepID=UPI0011A46BF0|nr:hypothetical protein [Gimesia fumaroli]